jgi:2Fe-2S iron-sulfur cluster protein
MFFTKGDLMFRKLHEPDPGGLTINIDGVPATAETGESVAAVLLRQAEPWSRLTPVTQSKRAPYCMTGVCFDCLAEVDGVASVQTCLKPVCDGMRVVRQTGKRRIDALTA